MRFQQIPQFDRHQRGKSHGAERLAGIETRQRDFENRLLPCALLVEIFNAVRRVGLRSGPTPGCILAQDDRDVVGEHGMAASDVRLLETSPQSTGITAIIGSCD